MSHKPCHQQCHLSRWGWGGFLFLLVYAIFMHSFHFADHSRTDQHVEEIQAELKNAWGVLEHLDQAITQLDSRVQGLEAKKRWRSSIGCDNS